MGDWQLSKHSSYEAIASSIALPCLGIGVKVNRSQNISVNVDFLKGSCNITVITFNIYWALLASHGIYMH